MSALLKLPVETGPLRRARRGLERQIQRFPRIRRAVVRACASSHPALADLAFSFPALLFVIAIRQRGQTDAQLARRVRQGVPLKVLALEAGLPMWLRKLPPEAFRQPIGLVPAKGLSALRIVNHLPRERKHAALWLELIAFAATHGHEPFALWAARHHAQLLAEEEDDDERELFWHRLCLWAWFSMAPETEAHRFIERRWTPSIRPEAALRAAHAWQSNMQLHAYLDALPEVLPWFAAGECDGYTFAPLATATAIREEAAAMANCLRTYGHALASGQVRLWSMRKDGKRVAVISLGATNDGLIGITQIRGHANKAVPSGVAIAARRWCAGQEATAQLRKQKSPNGGGRATLRERNLMRPYWLAKRRAPYRLMPLL